MSKLILLDIELNAIESFLKNIKSSAELEYSKINEKSKKNEFNHYDDEANAYFIPRQWEEIAIRASLGELNALVEWGLGNLALKAYNKKPNKAVFELNISRIIKLIEDYYEIELKEVNNFNNMLGIRNKVNSFKHRKGFKNPFKENCKSIPEKYKISYKETFQSIRDVRMFFINLWKIIAKKEVSSNLFPRLNNH